MGYYTSFKLTMHESADSPALLFSPLLAEALSEHFDDVNEASAYTYSKWYDSDDTMRDLSRDFPDVLFRLKGEGEEAGDLWVVWAAQGKLQECRGVITYPDFDEEKLA